jgi:hypothetical protein
MSQIQQIPVLAYDSHFMPLAEAAKNMTKTEFKNFMNLEKKKEKFNGILFEYSAEHEKTRLAVKDISRNIEIHNDKIKNLREMKIEGNLEKVELLVKSTRQRINVKLNLKRNSEIEYKKLFQTFEQKNTEFGRNSEMIHMEDDLYIENIDTRNREKEEKEEEKAFLKLFGKLPDELLRVIHSYFTYETRSTILVKTYNPVKMFCSLKKSGLQKVIDKINKKYAPTMKRNSRAWKVDPKLHTKMRTLYTLFYDEPRFSYSDGLHCKFNLSINEMKMYLQYIFLLFRKFRQHQWCFELYRMIIVCKK